MDRLRKHYSHLVGGWFLARKAASLGSKQVYDNNLSRNNADYQGWRNRGARGALVSPILDLCAWTFHVDSRLLRTLLRQPPQSCFCSATSADYCMLVNKWAWSKSQVCLLRLEVDMCLVLESELGQK